MSNKKLFLFDNNNFMKKMYIVLIMLIIGFICCFDILDSCQKINYIIKHKITTYQSNQTLGRTKKY